MQVSERTCNWRPGSAARAIFFPPRCCLAYQPFGAIVTGPGETYPENPNDSLYPWLNGQVSLLWRLKWVSWLSGMYNQPNVVDFLYIFASTFFTNSKKSGAVGNGNGDISVTFCHTCCREAGTNNDSLIFSISPRYPGTSDWHPIAIRKSTGSRKMPLCFSCFLEKKYGIWYYLVGWASPEKLQPIAKAGCPIASSPLTQNCRQDDPNLAQHWDTNPIGTPKH